MIEIKNKNLIWLVWSMGWKRNPDVYLWEDVEHFLSTNQITLSGTGQETTFDLGFVNTNQELLFRIKYAEYLDGIKDDGNTD